MSDEKKGILVKNVRDPKADGNVASNSRNCIASAYKKSSDSKPTPPKK